MVEVDRRLNFVSEREGFPKILEIIQEQAEKPPGNDSCIGAYYRSLSTLVREDDRVRCILQNVYDKRHSITPSHYVNLLFRVPQYILIHEEKNDSYRFYHREEDWRPTLTSLFSAAYSNHLTELLSTKDTVTTKYQRYAGPRALLSALWPDQELKVADFGCGANHGLPGIELGDPFEEIADFTPNQTFSQLLKAPIHFSYGLAVDKQNPEDPQVKAWTIACSYYPKELDQIEVIRKFERHLREKSKKVVFLNGDLLEPTTLDPIAPDHFHAVILSTVLYQLPPQSRAVILERAKEVLRPDGAVILQDFVRKDPKAAGGLCFDEPWFNDFGYRTMILPKNENNTSCEVFQWSDGRCHTVRAGDDFSKSIGQTKTVK